MKRKGALLLKENKDLVGRIILDAKENSGYTWNRETSWLDQYPYDLEILLKRYQRMCQRRKIPQPFFVDESSSYTDHSFVVRKIVFRYQGMNILAHEIASGYLGRDSAYANKYDKLLQQSSRRYEPFDLLGGII